MGLFSLAGAVGLAFTPEHKELVITAAVAVVAAIATLAISLSACGSAVFETGSCPTWPGADSAVAEEVERGMMPADQFPAF